MSISNNDNLTRLERVILEGIDDFDQVSARDEHTDTDALWTLLNQWRRALREKEWSESPECGHEVCWQAAMDAGDGRPITCVRNKSV